MPGELRGVLLDMDGTLLDTERLIHRSSDRMLTERGKEPLSEEEYGACIGLSEEEFWRRMRESRGLSESAEELAEIRLETMLAQLQGAVLEPLPGARELLEWLRRRALPHAVASASPKAQVEVSLRAAGMLSGLPAFVSGQEDCARNKPFPDVYLLAAERLGLDATECVAVEDSATGARAARDAGCYVLTVPSPGYEGPPPPCGHKHLGDLHEVLRALEGILR